MDDENQELAEETIIAESYKTSLLDTLRESHKNNKELRCTRVLYIGQMQSAKQKEIIESIHSEFIKLQQSKQDITGALLFINDNLFYHMIEVESLDSLQSLFCKMIHDPSTNFFQSIDPSETRKNKTNAELAELDVKICCISEEITREFPIWSVRNVKLPGGDGGGDGNKNKGNSDAPTEETDEVEEDEGSLQGILFETMKAMIEVFLSVFIEMQNECLIFASRLDDNCA